MTVERVNCEASAVLRERRGRKKAQQRGVAEPLKKQNCPKLSFRAVAVELSKDVYFFLRLITPVTSEPRPSKPSRGSGEAVWGSFCPLALAF